MLKPGETAMIIKLDIEGDVIEVTYADGKTPAEHEGPFQKEKKPVYGKKMVGHVVFAYETNPKCVTYQTPSGPRTV